MKSILRLAIVLVLLLIAALVYWREGDRWFAEAPKPPEVRWSEQQRRCLIQHVADDGHSEKEHRFMAHAILNLSEQKDNMSICRIHEKKLALSAPSQEGSKWTRYGGIAEWMEKMTDAANLAQAEVDVDRVLKERRSDYGKEPCLATITRFIRPKKWGTYQNEQKMEEEMTLLYDDGHGAKFYGPKGSTNKCQ